jgi:hypothetical protein
MRNLDKDLDSWSFSAAQQIEITQLLIFINGGSQSGKTGYGRATDQSQSEYSGGF